MTRHFEPAQLAVIWLRIVAAGFALIGVGTAFLGFALFGAALFLSQIRVSSADVRQGGGDE